MSPKKSGQDWTKTDESKLKSLANSNTTTKSIAKQLERTVDAIYTKASDLGVSLKPKDKWLT